MVNCAAGMLPGIVVICGAVNARYCPFALLHRIQLQSFVLLRKLCLFFQLSNGYLSGDRLFLLIRISRRKHPFQIASRLRFLLRMLQYAPEIRCLCFPAFLQKISLPKVPGAKSSPPRNAAKAQAVPSPGKRML